MLIRAQLSVYALRQARLQPAIDAAWSELAAYGLDRSAAMLMAAQLVEEGPARLPSASTANAR